MLLFALNSLMPEFIPEKDVILTHIDSLIASKVLKSTYVKRYPFDAFIQLSRDQAKDVFADTNNSLVEDAFSDELNSINLEIEKTCEELKSFYDSELDLKFFSKYRVSTVKGLYDIFQQYIIKARRLNYVAIPDFAVSTYISRKVNKKYETVKAFWIDASGNKVRSFNKNFGPIEQESLEMTIKLFQSLGYKTTQLEYSLANGAKVDLIVEKDNNKWVVDVKLERKHEFINRFVQLELWLHFKATYG
ncbi:MAG: hypothetical protein ACKOWO_06465 [Sediminibacterium sp.]